MKNKNNTLKQAWLETLIRIVLLAIPVVILIVIKAQNGNLQLDDFLDIDTFVSIVFAFVVQSLAGSIINSVKKEKEDEIKLTQNYPSLVKKYARESVLTYQGEKFPVLCLMARSNGEPPFDVHFDDSAHLQKYQIPTQVAQHSNELMEAHAHSKVYNRLAVRLNDVQREGDRVTLTCSQTYYYDSLITNRAMDYVLENGKTVREIYEPGPFLSALKESKLSNHLGYNGFLETADGKLIFVLRGKNLSIGKGTWATSIGASLKAEYALTDEKKITKQTLSYTVAKEIADELYIDVPQDVDFTQRIIAFYRDLVEGGKPQFLFYYKLENYTFEQFEKQFKSKYDEKDNVVDGTQFLGLSIDECRACKWTASGFTYQDKTYKMTASAAASVVMLLQYFDTKREGQVCVNGENV